MKRFSMWFLVVFMVMVGATAAYAEEVSEVPPPEQPTSGYDNGFFIRSKDGNFHFQVNMRFQLQHIFATGDTSLPESADGSTKVNTFRVRRARFSFAGNAYKKLDFFMMIQHASGPTGARDLLWFAEFTYNVNDHLRFTFGQTQVSVDRFGETSSGGYQLVEAPLTASQTDGQVEYSATRPSFGLPSDIGLKIAGDWKRFHYSVYFGNGSEEGNYNFNREFTYGTRMSFDILDPVGYGMESDFANSAKPKMTLGVGGAFLDDTMTSASDTNGDGVDDVSISYDWNMVGSMDFAFMWKGFSFKTEGYYRMLEVNGGTCVGYPECAEGRLTDVGYYAQTGYFVWPKHIELVFRGGQIFREGPDNNAYEATAGINWFIKDNKFKLQTAYSYMVDYDNVPGTANDKRHYIRTMFTMNI